MLLAIKSPLQTNCNVILYGITEDLLRRLQSVQNVAALLCLDSGARRSDHITRFMPLLRRLHWMPVKRRIQFKLALLVYKSLHGLTPRYLSDDCQLVSDVGHQMSPPVWSLALRRVSVHRAFQVAGPKLWNSFPAPLWQSDMIIRQFKSLLKTRLFSWDCGALVTCVLLHRVYVSTFTHTYKIQSIILCRKAYFSQKWHKNVSVSRMIVCNLLMFRWLYDRIIGVHACGYCYRSTSKLQLIP